jgi:hypothetical protein
MTNKPGRVFDTVFVLAAILIVALAVYALVIREPTPANPVDVCGPAPVTVIVEQEQPARSTPGLKGMFSDGGYQYRLPTLDPNGAAWRQCMEDAREVAGREGR